MQVPNQICEAIISTVEFLWIDLFFRAAMALTAFATAPAGQVNQLGRCTYPSRALSFDSMAKDDCPSNLESSQRPMMRKL